MVESKSMKVHRERLVLFSAGAVVAAAAFILVLLGNPGNMGFCIACFLRDIAGSLGLHSSATTQYLRPEIPGLVLGAFIVALARGEFRPTSGSAPVIRFIIAACVSIGALVFLGCPLRMVLRLAAGDLNALFGLVGFVIGIGLGCIALNFGFSLGRTKECSAIEGTSAPLLSVFLLILAFTAPSFLKASTEGPGSMHAPIFASLLMGLVVGALAQRSRLCFAGGVRDIFLMRDTTLITGFASVFAVALVLNLVSGNFRLGFEGQSVAHTDWLWNILARGRSRRRHHRVRGQRRQHGRSARPRHRRSLRPQLRPCKLHRRCDGCRQGRDRPDNRFLRPAFGDGRRREQKKGGLR